MSRDVYQIWDELVGTDFDDFLNSVKKEHDTSRLRLIASQILRNIFGCDNSDSDYLFQVQLMLESEFDQSAVLIIYDSENYSEMKIMGMIPGNSTLKIKGSDD